MAQAITPLGIFSRCAHFIDSRSISQWILEVRSSRGLRDALLLYSEREKCENLTARSRSRTDSDFFLRSFCLSVSMPTFD